MTQQEMDPTTEKIILTIAMFLSTVIFALIPSWIGSRLSTSRLTILEHCSCASGGVFIAALFLDLLPEVNEAIDQIKPQLFGDFDFPIGYFVVCIGFFLPLAIEQLALAIKDTVRNRDADGLIDEDSSNPPQDHHHDHSHMPNTRSNGMRSLLLLLALSFHSIFEGLAIGLQQELGRLLSLFIAVVAHKGIMALSFGLTLERAKLGWKKTLSSILTFSLASPIGMAFGLLISDFEKTLTVQAFNAFLQAIAAGTFLFVTFIEVLPTHFNKGGFLQFIMLFAGFMSFVGLLFVIEHH